MDHILLQLRWDLFQPKENIISKVMLERLKLIFDACMEFKIEVVLCFFTGWLSGFWFLSSFVYEISESH